MGSICVKPAMPTTYSPPDLDYYAPSIRELHKKMRCKKPSYTPAT